jgi:pimeloyl-ACP methyl ester carboxylesterase
MWDYADQEAHQAAAGYIAGWVQVLSKDCPNSKLILVGYSSGTNVVLSAAALCPPRSLHRIVLLAPAVSYAYDLQPALKASRCGIDSFFSAWDGVLQMAEERMGSADGQPTATAGRVGFWPPIGGAEMAASGALRQHPWRDDMGGHGGHFSWTTTTFTRRVLVPLLLAE